MNTKKDDNTKMIIYVLVIAILFVSILGTTISYYLIKTSSNDVDLTSAYIKLGLTDGKTISANNLIPSDFDKVEYAYKQSDDKKCKDMYSMTICSVYSFNVENIGDTANFVMYLSPSLNELSNLTFALYRVDDTDNSTLIYKSDEAIANEEISLLGYDEDGDANTFSLGSENGTVNYELVLYIKNEDRLQSEDMNKRFSGSIIIRLVNYDGSIIVEDRG